MRLAKLSFLGHALLLSAVAAAQSADANNLLGDLTTDTTSSTESTVTDGPTTTSSAPSETPTTTESTSTESTSSVPTESTTSETPTITSSDEPTKTSSETTTSETETSSDTQKPVVTTITSFETVSGTTVPTVMTTTSAPAEPSSPSLNGDSSSSTSSGVSESDKTIIIGVVVGVGGAIVLGVLGVVIWRIHKKRNEQNNDEDDDLMGGTAVGSGPREKAPSPAQSGGTPFKTTLDQYHNPGPVNAASNF